MLLIFLTVVFYCWLNHTLTDWLIDWFTELFPQARRWWQRGSCRSRWTRCRRWWCSHARSHIPHLSGLVGRIRIGANTKGATLDNRSGESRQIQEQQHWTDCDAECTAQERGRNWRHNTWLEIRCDGRGSFVPYYFHAFHHYSHAGGVVFGATFHCKYKNQGTLQATLLTSLPLSLFTILCLMQFP